MRSKTILSIILLMLSIFWAPFLVRAESVKGIGGGGAFANFSISPYDDLWFVGTDMGTLFRSENLGQSWEAIPHSEIRTSADLKNEPSVGFAPDKNSVYYGYSGCYPHVSNDRGKTWTLIDNLYQQLSGGDYFSCYREGYTNNVRYWFFDETDHSLAFAATRTGIYKSSDFGVTWKKVGGINELSIDTFIDYVGDKSIIYHATSQGIYKSIDKGETFTKIHSDQMHSFAGGRDSQGLTLAYLSDDVAACAEQEIGSTAENCGYVWVSKDNGDFTNTKQIGGNHVRMARNNSQVIYSAGSRQWDKEPGFGTSVWKSTNAGDTWTQTFQQYVDRGPWYSWNPALFEMSAVAFDVGLHDDGYYTFVVDPKNADIAGGTGNYFLHVTYDQGQTWKSPITEYADNGPRGKQKRWRSIGLENTTVNTFKFHPTNPQIGYAGYSDIGGLVTEDGGDTWRISKKWNSTYDYAFDPANDQVAFAAMSTMHDWPEGPYRHSAINPFPDAGYYYGGIYKTTDRGRSWTQLTPETFDWGIPFLSVAYDNVNNIMYGGSQGKGVGVSYDGGSTWEWITSGFAGEHYVIGEIHIDPENQDVYALLSGDKPHYTNIDKTGIHKLNKQTKTWELLRGTLNEPYEGNKFKLWHYPVTFAVDWSDPERKTLWLGDARVPQSYLTEGAWKSVDGGQTWNQMFTMPDIRDIKIHPQNSSVVYASGAVDLDIGSEPNSGVRVTTDGGQTWSKNFDVPIHHLVTSVTLDPNNPEMIYYNGFGAGIYHMKNPVDKSLFTGAVPETVTPETVVPEENNNIDYGKWDSYNSVSQLITSHQLSGELIKSPSSSAVYFLKDGKRNVFPNESVFYSWFNSFDSVRVVTEQVLSQYPLGKNMTYAPGSLFKLASDPKVYVVLEDNKIDWVPTESHARKFFGTNWNRKIHDTSESYFLNYTLN